MVAPATPYTIRGFLWYQGETDSSPERAPMYARLFPTMIEDWRSKWKEGELPFLFVQISSFDSPPEIWGVVRDAQRQTLSVSNTAMAVSLDRGLEKNVHPPDKQTIGHRLALGARKLSYGETLEWSGPLFRQATREGATVRLWFDHAESGLRVSGAAIGFELAGTDGHFVPARASIHEQTVLVEAEGVSLPAIGPVRLVQRHQRQPLQRGRPARLHLHRLHSLASLDKSGMTANASSPENPTHTISPQA